MKLSVLRSLCLMYVPKHLASTWLKQKHKLDKIPNYGLLFFLFTIEGSLIRLLIFIDLLRSNLGNISNMATQQRKKTKQSNITTQQAISSTKATPYSHHRD